MPDGHHPPAERRRADRMTPAVYQILLSLADRPRHGYDIMREIERRTSGEIRIGPGTLYRSIARMREARWIAETRVARTVITMTDDRRRSYALTPNGRDALTAETRRLSRLLDQATAKGVLWSHGPRFAETAGYLATGEALTASPDLPVTRPRTTSGGPAASA